MSNDFDVKGKDMRQHFALFGRKNLGDEHQSILQLAKSTMPENHIGDKLWLTQVSGCTVYGDAIKDWAREFAHAIATCVPIRRIKSKTWLVASYNATWGDYAALDGIVIATGFGERISARSREKQFGCNRDAYVKVRNLVAGALLQQSSEFEEAMGHSFWVHSTYRD